MIVLNPVVVGPAVEEFVFRGLLLRPWVASRGPWPGLPGSAAVFAVLHPHMWVGALATGVVLGLLYLWSRSLLVPILAHVFHNGLVALAIVTDSADEATEPAASPAQALAEVQAEWALPVAALLLVAALLGALARPLVREVRGRALLAIP